MVGWGWGVNIIDGLPDATCHISIRVNCKSPAKTLHVRPLLESTITSGRSTANGITEEDKVVLTLGPISQQKTLSAA